MQETGPIRLVSGESGRRHDSHFNGARIDYVPSRSKSTLAEIIQSILNNKSSSKHKTYNKAVYMNSSGTEEAGRMDDSDTESTLMIQNPIHQQRMRLASFGTA